MGKQPNLIRLVVRGTIFMAFALVLTSLAVVRTNAQEANEGVLINATTAEIEAAALRYTNNRFEVLSDPVVTLSHSVELTDLPTLGLPELAFEKEAPPLMIVALQGKFDVSNIRGAGKLVDPWIVGHIVYIFDLNIGVPTYIAVSPDADTFRSLYNSDLRSE